STRLCGAMMECAVRLAGNGQRFARGAAVRRDDRRNMHGDLRSRRRCRTTLIASRRAHHTCSRISGGLPTTTPGRRLHPAPCRSRAGPSILQPLRVRSRTRRSPLRRAAGDSMSESGERPARREASIALVQNGQEPLIFPGAELTPEICQRIVEARDPRYDGVFFVAITTTRVYCRPVCPARVVHRERRRFFASAAAAEHAGYRPCLRCRPELAPGRALCDAVSRLASAAAHRIAAGALNGRSVVALARELCVSERHLRRALERELGVSPVELAQ